MSGGCPKSGCWTACGQHREEHSVFHHKSLKYHLVLQWCPKSRWTLKGKIKGSPPFSRRTLLRTPLTMYHIPNHKQNHEQNNEQNQDSWAKPWTINQGLTLSTTRSSCMFYSILTWFWQSFVSSESVKSQS